MKKTGMFHVKHLLKETKIKNVSDSLATLGW